MLHSQWNPMRELVEAQQSFSNFFEKSLRQQPRPHNGQAAWTPAVDVSETAEAYIFTADLPGMKPEQVEVEVKGDTLTFKGERTNPAFKEDERFHHRERPAGRFARAFRLPKPVDANRVTATYRDGVLSIVVPQRAEAKPRKIEIGG